MSRESRIFSVRAKGQVNQKVKEFESFGWELLSINGTDIAMSRNTQIEVYTELIKHEYEYEELVEKRDKLLLPTKPFEFKFSTALILFLIFILPAVIYIVLYFIKKTKYEEQLNEYRAKYDNLTNQIKSVCDTARAIFFSKRS